MSDWVQERYNNLPEEVCAVQIEGLSWFPGHMTKTKRMIAAEIGHMDAVCEIVDARIPQSSRNPDVDVLTAGKPRMTMVSICSAISALPTWKVVSRGRDAVRSGQGTRKIPATKATKTMPLVASAPRLLCSIDIGISPAGFIM